MPDRVIDAPIPDHIDKMLPRDLAVYAARLEAEKQAAQDALTWIERNYVWGTRIVAQALSAKPTAAKPEPSPSSAKQGEPS